MAPPPGIEGASAISGKKPVYEDSVDCETATGSMEDDYKEELVDCEAATYNKEDDYDEWFRKYWYDLPKSLCEVPFGVGCYGGGKDLMEIFEIRIISNVNTKTHKLNIHGSVTVDSAYGTSDIFRRSHRNPLVIHSEESLTMMGPHMGIVADDYSDIELDIKDGGRQLYKGSLCWSYFHFSDNLFNKPLTQTLAGNNCRCQITYAVFNCAMLINVEIKLPVSSNPMKIYGTINASIKGVKAFDSVKTTLFMRKKGNSAIVSAKGGLLPLSKSLMAFPLNWTLELSVHLKEHLLFNSGSCNIVKIVVQCTPKQFGDHKLIIQSKYGPMEVNLTAYPMYMHPNTFAALNDFLRKFI